MWFIITTNRIMQNNILLPLQEIARTAKSYPELVQGMVNIGIQSYTVDVATGTTLYRMADGEIALKEGSGELKEITHQFMEEATIQAVKDTQQGKIDYPTFMERIAKTGVRFYEATLQGTKRVTYVGTGGYYEEEIPV